MLMWSLKTGPHPLIRTGSVLGKPGFKGLQQDITKDSSYLDSSTQSPRQPQNHVRLNNILHSFHPGLRVKFMQASLQPLLSQPTLLTLTAMYSSRVRILWRRSIAMAMTHARAEDQIKAATESAMVKMLMTVIGSLEERVHHSIIAISWLDPLVPIVRHTPDLLPSIQNHPQQSDHDDDKEGNHCIEPVPKQQLQAHVR